MTKKTIPKTPKEEPEEVPKRKPDQKITIKKVEFSFYVRKVNDFKIRCPYCNELHGYFCPDETLKQFYRPECSNPKCKRIFEMEVLVFNPCDDILRNPQKKLKEKPYHETTINDIEYKFYLRKTKSFKMTCPHCNELFGYVFPGSISQTYHPICLNPECKRIFEVEFEVFDPDRPTEEEILNTKPLPLEKAQLEKKKPEIIFVEDDIKPPSKDSKKKKVVFVKNEIIPSSKTSKKKA